MDTQDLQKLKNKYDIIGNDPALNRALEMAVAVAPTDLTVLVTGESGVGKDNIPKIIHQFSRRKNAKYFAVNCGAIPEGTIDSELFGHEKALLPGQSRPARVISRKLTAVRFFWTRWVNCRFLPRPSSSGCCSPGSTSVSVRRK